MPHQCLYESRLSQLYPDLDTKGGKIQNYLRQLRELGAKGVYFSELPASLIVLANTVLGRFSPPFFIVRAWTEKLLIANGIEGGGDTSVEATVKINIGKAVEHEVAGGHGPVNAFDKVLRLALEKHFLCLKSITLDDYKVRKLGNGEGSASVVGVVVDFCDSGDNTRWSTVGFSSDIIEASWRAMIDAILYKLFKDGE